MPGTFRRDRMLRCRIFCDRGDTEFRKLINCSFLQTANLAIVANRTIPGLGSYAGAILHDDKTFRLFRCARNFLLACQVDDAAANHLPARTQTTVSIKFFVAKSEEGLCQLRAITTTPVPL